MKKQMFKIQRPIFTNDPSPTVLIYNKDRSIEDQLPMTEEVLKLFPPIDSQGPRWTGYKVFCEGIYNEDTGNIDLCGALHPDPDAFDW